MTDVTALEVAKWMMKLLETYINMIYLDLLVHLGIFNKMVHSHLGDYSVISLESTTDSKIPQRFFLRVFLNRSLPDSV